MEKPHQPKRKAVETGRDRVAGAVDKWRDEQQILRRKRYTLKLDLDLRPPFGPIQACAPERALGV